MSKEKREEKKPALNIEQNQEEIRKALDKFYLSFPQDRMDSSFLLGVTHGAMLDLFLFLVRKAQEQKDPKIIETFITLVKIYNEELLKTFDIVLRDKKIEMAGVPPEYIG